MLKSLGKDETLLSCDAIYISILLLSIFYSSEDYRQLLLGKLFWLRWPKTCFWAQDLLVTMEFCSFIEFTV